MEPCPHSGIRHGGAASKYLRGVRKLGDIQHRGKCKGETSVQRYAQPGTLAEQWSKVSRETMSKAEGAAARLRSKVKRAL